MVAATLPELVIAGLVIYLLCLVFLAGIGALVKEADSNASKILDEERRRREPVTELDQRRRRRGR